MLAAVAVSLGGCAADPARGYSFEAPYRTDTRTVGVRVFDNQTFATGLEVPLTESVIRQLQARTPWKLTDPDSADLVLSGAITGVDLSTLSRTRGTGLPQEMAQAVTVRFSLTESKSGKAVVERTNFRSVSTFVPDRRTGERIEVGQRGAIEELATDIVASLRSDW